MKKKILFVCQFFFPEQLSSAILPYELACKLSESGYDVNVLAGYPNDQLNINQIPFKEAMEGIEIERIKYIPANKNNILGRLTGYFSFCLAVYKNRKKFKDIDYCISYTNPPFLPPLIAMLSKKYHFKFYFEIYDLYPDTAIRAGAMKLKSLSSQVFFFCTNYALKNSERIIVLSEECKKYLTKTRNGLNSEKIAVIPNWYKRLPVSHKAYPKNQLKILYGGNMGIMQDMDTILNAAKKLKNDNRFEFIFVGQGAKKEAIKNFIRENNLINCTLHDFLPKESYDLLLDHVDMAIVSLEKFGVGLGSPSKLYGYLSKGIPIIAIISSHTDISKDITNFRNGIRIDNGDSDNLVTNLLNIYSDQDQLLDMCNNALNLFNSKYTLEQTSSLFLDILNDSASSPDTVQFYSNQNMEYKL